MDRRISLFASLLALLHTLFFPFVEAKAAANAQATAAALSRQLDNPIVPITENMLQADAANVQTLLNANPALNNSALGMELRQKAARVNNFEAIKKGFANCETKDPSTEQSLLAIAATMSPKSISTCKLKGDPLAGAAESIRLSTFQDEVSRNALKDATDAYFNIEMKYGKAQPDHIADTLCGGAAGSSGDTCNAGDRKLIQDRLAAWQAGPKPKHLDDEHEFFTLNHQLFQANKSLGMMNIDASLTHPDITQDTKDRYAQYAHDYMQAANLPSGFLLSTQTMQDYFGGIRRMPEDLHRGLFDYSFDQHHISNDGSGTENGEYGPKIVMQNAINEELKTTIDQVQTIAKQDAVKAQQESNSGGGSRSWRNEEKSKDDLEYLLNTNPQAIAKALLNNPGLTGDVCGIIQKTQADNARHAVIHKIAVYGAMALGAAALVFGLWGLLAPGAVIAGVGVGALAAVSGTLAAGVEFGNANADAQETKAQMLALQNQILEHTNVSEGTIRDYTTAVGRLNDDYNTMVVSGAATVVGAAFSVPELMATREASLAANAGRTLTATEQVNAARSVDATIQDINAASRSGKPVEQALEHMSQITGPKETTNLVSDLSDVSPATRGKLLNKLPEISEDPGKVKTLEHALENAEKSCGI